MSYLKVYVKDSAEPDFTCYSYNEERGNIHGDYNHVYFGGEYRNLMMIYHEDDEHLYWQGFLDAVESFNRKSKTKISFELLQEMIRIRTAQLDNPQNIVITDDNN